MNFLMRTWLGLKIQMRTTEFQIHINIHRRCSVSATHVPWFGRLENVQSTNDDKIDVEHHSQ